MATHLLLKYRHFSWAFLLLLLIFFVASPLLYGNLFFSQDELILNYWSWRTGIGPYHFLPIGRHNDRPVGWFIIDIMYELFGANYRIHLMTILIIHWINSLLVFLLARKLFKIEFIAPLCALLFACLYPANSTVFYIGAIFDQMCGFFILLSLLSFLHPPFVTNKFISVACYYAALRAKEMALALPVILAFLYWAINRLEITSKNAIKVAKQIGPFMLVLTIILAIYIKTGKIGGKTLASTHPYFMDFTFDTGYKLFNHYISRLSWVPERLHPGSILIAILTISTILNRRELTASIIGLIAIISPVLFYPNHIFDIYLYTPNIFFSLIIGSLIKETYEFFVDQTKQEKRLLVKPILASAISAVIIALTVLSFQSNEFQNYMRLERETREPLSLLADTLSNKLPKVQNNTTFYIADLPHVSRNQEKHWPLITNLIRLVYRNDTLKVLTDNMFPDITKKYNTDQGNKIFLLWKNNKFIIKQSNSDV